MRKNGTRILGLLLAVLMLFQMPVSALAEESFPYEEEILLDDASVSEEEEITDSEEISDRGEISDSEEISDSGEISDPEETAEDDAGLTIESIETEELTEETEATEPAVFSANAAPEEAQEIHVTVSISKDGKFLDDKDGNPMAGREITLSNQVSYTMDDALKAAHDLYYPGGSEAGYDYHADASGQYKGLIYKLWGWNRSDVPYIKISLNHDCGNYQSALSRNVKDGDEMHFYIQQNKGVDLLAYFTETEKIVSENQSFTLRLKQSNDIGTKYEDCAGAAVYIDGKKQEDCVTDETGRVVIKGLTARETPYFITAEKTTQTSDGGTGTAISAVYANVTVVKNSTETGNYLKKVTLYAESTQNSEKKTSCSLDVMNEQQTFTLPTETVYGSYWTKYMGVELSEDAPDDCEVYAVYEYPKDGTVQRIRIHRGERSVLSNMISGRAISSIKVEVLRSGNVTESHEFSIRYKGHLRDLTVKDSWGHTLDTGLQDNIQNQNLELYVAENAKYLEFRVYPYFGRAKMSCDDETAFEGDYAWFRLTLDWTAHEEYVLPIMIDETGSNYSDELADYTLTVKKGDKDYTPDVSVTSDKTNTTSLYEGTEPVTLTADVQVDQLEEGKLSYQWYYIQTPFPDRIFRPQDVDKKDYIKIENATEKSLIVATDQPWNERYYCCIVTFEIDGKIFSTTSNFTGITVLKKNVDIPVISKQPESAIYLDGQSFDVQLEVGIDDAPWTRLSPEYQWYKNSGATIEGATPVAGATKSTYAPEKPEEKDYYYCAVRFYRYVIDSSGRKTEYGEYAYSDIVSVTKENVKFSWEGNGTAAKPFLIQGLSDLEALRDKVNQEGFSFEGIHFQMTGDITLPSDWKPIGAIEPGQSITGDGKYLWPFAGSFDGGGYTLTMADGGKPLFNYVRNAVVENLKLAGKNIDGYGLIDCYTVDYGTDGNYTTGCPATVTIRNVTLKSGMSTKNAGLLGGYASGANTVVIENCTAEQGVVIGYTGQEGSIGTFAGTINGIIRNSHSAATVYGTNRVGGLAGNKGQSMGLCTIENSSFTGSVIASGNWVGGILGSGYEADSAPNTPVASVKNCYVAGSVSGASNVGGIFGGEPSCKQCWGNGSGAIANNFFYGTVSGSSNTGAIVGYLRGFDKFQGIANNYYLDSCGVSAGIGGIGTILTTAGTHQDLPYEVDAAYGIDYTFDQKRYCFPKTAAEFADGTVTGGLNSGNYNNWEQGSSYPVYGQGAYAVGLSLTGNYKKEYYIGEELDLTGGTFTVTWSDGTKTHPEANEITVVGYDPNKRGSQMLSLKYGAVETTITVGVLLRAGQIEVKFTLLGDYVHDSDADRNVHTLSNGTLETWIPETGMIVSSNAKVKDALEQALQANGMTCENATGNYVSAITRNGVTLAEFTNGRNSGWMYTLNGKHPDLGVNEQYLSSGDVIIFHYTDDYVNEEHVHQWSDRWSSNEIVHWHECEWDCGQRKDQASHSWSAWQTTQAATYTSAEVQMRYCTVCGREQTRSVGSPLTPPASTMQLNATKVTLKYGQSTTGLKVTGLQAGDAVQSYKSSNTSIFTVNKNGKLTAKKKAGSATLTITLKSGLSKKVTVTVQKGTVKTTKLSGIAKKLTLDKGKSCSLKPVLTPFTSQEKITYSSSNKKVATVSAKGVIKAKKAGTAKITVKSGKKKVTMTVTVPKTATKSIAVPVSVSVKKGKTYSLKAKRTPKNSEEKITYKSSNKKIATVTSSGKIKGIKKGTATITVKSGKVTKKVTVTVK